MALADWSVSADGGFYSIVVDGTSPGTNTSVIAFTGDLGLSNVTVGDVQNVSAEAYIKLITSSNGSSGFQLRSNALPIDGSAGQHAFEFRVEKNGSNFDVSIYRKISGGFTLLAAATNAAPLTGLNTDWQKWRASVFTSGAASYLRMELWNGAAYVSLVDCADTNVTLLTLAGKAKFFNRANATNRLDDVKIYTLA